MKNKFLLLIAAFTLISNIALAQAGEVEMADGLRASGKIYAVVAVCLTILIGLFIYVFLIDRKISKLERKHL